MKKLVIYGAAFPDIVKIIDDINQVSLEWEILGFINDQEIFKGKNVLGMPILGNNELIPELAKQENIYFFSNHYGHYKDFKERTELLINNNCKIPTIIHPSANINYVELGQGCLIANNCKLGSNIKIGNFVTVRQGSIISHDSEIADYSMIAPGCNVGSCCVLKEGCFLGSGSKVLRTKIIGSGATVGCGAVVVGNVKENMTVVGNPAKKIKYNIFKKIIGRAKRDYKKFENLINTSNLGIKNEKTNN